MYQEGLKMESKFTIRQIEELREKIEKLKIYNKMLINELNKWENQRLIKRATLIINGGSHERDNHK